jgi:hypothetical protein
MIKNIILGLVGVVVIGLGGRGIWAYQQVKNAEQQIAQQPLSTVVMANSPISSVAHPEQPLTTKKTEVVKDTSTQNGITLKTNIKADVTTTTSCGTTNCFQQKFTTCQPATLEADAGFAAVYYKILHPVDSYNCRVMFKYIKNPNPNWVNKEMTCTFANNLNFGIEKQVGDEIAYDAAGGIGNPNSCEGPLYSTLQPKQASLELATKAPSQISISNLSYATVSMANIKNYIGKTLTFKLSNPSTGMKICSDNTRVKTSGITDLYKDDACVYNKDQSPLFSYNSGSGVVSVAVFPSDSKTAESMMSSFVRDEISRYGLELYVQDGTKKQSNRLKFTITK